MRYILLIIFLYNIDTLLYILFFRGLSDLVSRTTLLLCTLTTVTSYVLP